MEGGKLVNWDKWCPYEFRRFAVDGIGMKDISYVLALEISWISHFFMAFVYLEDKLLSFKW